MMFSVATPDYYLFALGLVGYMIVMWVIRIPAKNDYLVDFAWPSSFTALTLYFYVTGPGYEPRKQLITTMVLICGFRFMVGYLHRNWKNGEDGRCEQWRARWRNGEGLFGIRSVHLNLFVFYLVQQLGNVLFVAAPIALACYNPSPEVSALEWACVGLWVVAFALENVADTQLLRFKSNPKNAGKVLDRGLWRYSRHPNYFFEVLIWLSYIGFALGSANTWLDYLGLGLFVLVIYYFLVHLTGIPMTEKASVVHRGQAYLDYQARTSMFFPWFPRSSEPKTPVPAPIGSATQETSG